MHSYLDLDRYNTIKRVWIMLLIPRRLVINKFYNSVAVLLHFLYLWHYFAAASLMHPGFSATHLWLV